MKLAVKPQKLTPAMERVLEDIRAGSELWSHHGRYWLQGAYSIKVNKTVAHALLTRGLIRLAIAGDSIKNSKWELVGQK